jgi:hypothetical protein
MTEPARSAPVVRFVWSLPLLLALACLSILRSAPSRADAVPADPAAHGYVGLCGVDGKPMISGDIHDKPFVWTAVASQPAPREARGARPVATLYAFQPRPDVPAGDWNGDQLTATSPYATRGAPATQATKLDNGLDYVVKDYPPMVDGLYELRLYFGNSHNSAYTDQYAATFIKVVGDRWSVAQGGTVDCSKGHAVSPEIAAIGKASAAGTPTASAPYGGPAGTGVATNARGVPVHTSPNGGHGSSSASRRASGKNTGASHPVSGPELSPGMTISGSAAAAQSPVAGKSAEAASASAGSATWIIAIVVVAAVAAGGGWFARRRTQH